MKINSEFVMPTAPDFGNIDLPEDEQEVGYYIEHNVQGLQKHATDVASAIALFQLSKIESMKINGKNLYGDFMWIAVRDAVMSLYHIGWIMETIPSLFRKCDTWKAAVDHAAIRAAKKRFKLSFPNATDIRHSVAHAAELYSTPEKAQTNQFEDKNGDFGTGFIEVTGGGTMTVMGNIIADDQYQTTYDGGLFKVNMNAETIHEVQEILVEYFAPFRVL